MIDFDIINDPELENHIKILDEKIEHLKSKFDIELKTYSYILRIGLNIIQDESFENLIERINHNRELENALNNLGGYEIDFLYEL